MLRNSFRLFTIGGIEVGVHYSWLIVFALVTWSLSTLQRTLRGDALPQIGASTVRRVLADAGSSYQRTRTWCPTGTAQRKRKDGVVRVVDPLTEQKRG